MDEERTGAEELRLIVSNMNVTRESFNDRFTADQLLQIGRMLIACGWDIYPDQWTERQVKEALKGIVPEWDDNERPVYSTRKRQALATKRAARRVGMPDCVS